MEVFLISTNDLRTGVTVEIDGDVYIVVDFQHVNPEKVQLCQNKNQNIKTGQVFERAFRTEKSSIDYSRKKPCSFVFRR